MNFPVELHVSYASLHTFSTSKSIKKMRWIAIFITAVFVIFLTKLRWHKNNLSLYHTESFRTRSALGRASRAWMLQPRYQGIFPGLGAGREKMENYRYLKKIRLDEAVTKTLVLPRRPPS